MPRPRLPLALALATVATGLLLVGILVAMVAPFRSVERAGLERNFIQHYADALYPAALQQLAESKAAAAGRPAGTADLLIPILTTVRQHGMLGVAVFDSEGKTIKALPPSLVLPELSPEDYPRLLGGDPISRFDPGFPVDQYFSRVPGSADPGRIPVLEVLLPLHLGDATQIVGFVQYFIDGRRLADELGAVDRGFNRDTAGTLAIGAGLIAVVLAAAYFGFRRAERLIGDRNDRLMRANFELTLAAKASALGQITSHLIHGLQGPVAGLSAVVTGRDAGDAGASDWSSAAAYTARLQLMIQETVALLGDESAHVGYQLTGRELADTIRRRNTPAAAEKGAVLEVAGKFAASVDSHRGSLLCLIAANLVQNAIAATPAGGRITVTLRQEAEALTLTVADQGRGIPEPIREHLFEAGRSGRPGGTGLGLAISRLLARQIGANLGLESTGPAGTVFQLTLPL